MRLVETGVKTPPRDPKPPRPALTAPPDFQAALQADAKAGNGFEALSPSQRREYIEWVLEAKREATRQQRIRTAIQWLGEGKPRHWKYQS